MTTKGEQRQTEDGLVEEIVPGQGPQHPFIVRELSFDQFAALQGMPEVRNAEGGIDGIELMPRTLMLSIVDESGNPRYVGDEGRAKLGRLGQRLLMELYRVADRLNGSGEAEVEAAKKPSDETHG